MGPEPRLLPRPPESTYAGKAVTVDGKVEEFRLVVRGGGSAVGGGLVAGEQQSPVAQQFAGFVGATRRVEVADRADPRRKVGATLAAVGPAKLADGGALAFP